MTSNRLQVGTAGRTRWDDVPVSRLLGGTTDRPWVVEVHPLPAWASRALVKADAKALSRTWWCAYRAAGASKNDHPVNIFRKFETVYPPQRTAAGVPPILAEIFYSLRSTTVMGRELQRRMAFAADGQEMSITGRIVHRGERDFDPWRIIDGQIGMDHAITPVESLQHGLSAADRRVASMRDRSATAVDGEMPGQSFCRSRIS